MRTVLPISVMLILILCLLIPAISCSTTSSQFTQTPPNSEISSIKIRIVENSPERLVIAFDYFTEHGQPVRFSNADFAVHIGISTTEYLPGQPARFRILASGVSRLLDPGVVARIVIEILHTSEEVISIPRSSVDLDGVNKSDLWLFAWLCCGTIMPRYSYGASNFAEIKLALP